MISRIVDCNVKPDKLDALRSKLNTDFLPRIKQQTGFVDVIESVDPDTGHFVCNTFWKTQNDVKQYDSTLFQEIATALTPLLTAPPNVSTLQVENSTPHKITAGKTAAAA